MTIEGGRAQQISPSDATGSNIGALIEGGNFWRSSGFECAVSAAITTCIEVKTKAGFTMTATGLQTFSRLAGALVACPDFYVIDSRGSGEDAGTISPPAARFAAAFKALETGESVKPLANPYPARGNFSVLAGAKLHVPGAYFNSVTSGKTWLAAEIPAQQRRCSASKLILTGYSQGAHVTGDVVQRHASYPNVAAVVLFGDPYFNGRDPVDRGNPRFRTGTNGGLGERPRFSQKHVLSYCHSNDPVCQNTANPIALFTWHNNYDKLGEPAEAAGIVARWLGGSAPSGKTLSCGSLSLTFDTAQFSSKIVSNGTSCSTSRWVLTFATRKPVSLGETLPTPTGWACFASLRPEVGYNPKWMVACEKGSHKYSLDHVDFGLPWKQ